jgi:hypothetical protein
VTTYRDPNPDVLAAGRTARAADRGARLARGLRPVGLVYGPYGTPARTLYVGAGGTYWLRRAPGVYAQCTPCGREVTT